MNDRELLEIAARAIGFGLCADGKYTVCWTESNYPRGAKTKGALWNYIGYDETAQLWNPLTDDGDALRLAVDLSLTVFTGGVGCVSVSGWIVCGVDAKPIGLTEHYGSGDKYAATRRAIVLAAAEIGRMKK